MGLQGLCEYRSEAKWRDLRFSSLPKCRPTTLASKPQSIQPFRATHHWFSIAFIKERFVPALLH
jgi:hypothetical protein